MSDLISQDSMWRIGRVSVIVLFIACLMVGAVMFFSSSAVMATGLSVSDADTTVDRGTLDSASVDANAVIRWDGAEENPGDTVIQLQLEKPGSDNGYETLAEHSEELNGAAGEYQYAFDSESVIDGDTSWAGSDFKPGGDGQSKTTELNFRIRVTPSGDLDGDGSTSTFSSSATALVTVVNEESSENSGGNIDVSAEGTDKDPEDNPNPGNGNGNGND